MKSQMQSWRNINVHVFCFVDDVGSQVSVKEWELTRCVEDVYKVSKPEGIHTTP